jgi:hypothetical protein
MQSASMVFRMFIEHSFRDMNAESFPCDAAMLDRGHAEGFVGLARTRA